MLKTLHFKDYRATVVYEELPQNKIAFSIAQCSKKDQYSRKRGREEAVLHYIAGNKLIVRFKKSDACDIRRLLQTFSFSLNYGA